MLRIFRLPATFITAVQWFFCRLLCTAFRTELAFIECTTAANPACRLLRSLRTTFRTELACCDITTTACPASPFRPKLWFRFLCTAFWTEFACHNLPTAACPTVCTLLLNRRCCHLLLLHSLLAFHFLLASCFLLLGTHRKQILRIHATACIHGHTHTDKTIHGTTLIGCRRFHCISLCANHRRSCHRRILQHRCTLSLFDHLCILIRKCHRTESNADDLQSTQFTPFGRQRFIHRILHRYCVSQSGSDAVPVQKACQRPVEVH